eukprot:8763860-Heterocapsa_arctica.AAC.1
MIPGVSGTAGTEWPNQAVCNRCQVFQSEALGPLADTACVSSSYAAKASRREVSEEEAARAPDSDPRECKYTLGALLRTA